MKLKHKIKMDLLRKGIPPRMDAVQNDSGGRMLVLELTEGTQPWPVPADAQVLVRYSKPDHTGGCYDTMPDGTRAWSAQGNLLCVTLAPQVLTAAGTVELAVTLSRESILLTTFNVLIDVQRSPGFSGTSENYSYVTAFLPQPAGGARLGQYLRASRVDQQGNILALEAVNAAGGGLGQESKSFLLTLLQNAVYTQDVSQTLSSLEQSLSAETESAVPTGLSAVYSGGSVAAGTALGYFLGKVAVTRYYSDGSTRVLDPSQYSIIGNSIAAGQNILTARDLETGLTCSFTVTGTALLYTVTTSLYSETAGSSLSQASSQIAAGNRYESLLAIPDGQELVGITVTMGGVDITAACVSGRNITISAVTADVVITVTVKDSDAVFYSVTKQLTNVTCSGSTSVQENAAYTAALTVSDGYALESVTVTMGGNDVTSFVYANGIISIAAVTGNIVITAVAVNNEIEVTMTGISAQYTGGDVAIGTAVTELKGITVTAHYSDGSTQNVEKYALTGTISEGSNIIIVGYNGFTTRFTVTGVAEGSTSLCTVTNHMTNATTNNTLPGVSSGSAYTATITANEGYVLDRVTVTMGGTDVTASVYADGVIYISAVTGNIVITATAVESESGSAGTAGEPVAYTTIQGYLKSGATAYNYIFVEESNGATSVYFEAVAGQTYRISMTENTNRFRIAFAAEAVANNVVFDRTRSLDGASETIFTVPSGYSYVCVYLGGSTYPTIPAGFSVTTYSAERLGSQLLSGTDLDMPLCIGRLTCGTSDGICKIDADPNRISALFGLSIGLRGCVVHKTMVSIDDYDTYKYAIGDGTNWLDGGYVTADSMIDLTDGCACGIQIIRNDGAAMTESDLEYLTNHVWVTQEVE